MIACDRCGTVQGNVRRFVAGVLKESDPGIEPRYHALKDCRPERMDLCSGCLAVVAESMRANALSIVRPLSGPPNPGGDT